MEERQSQTVIDFPLGLLFHLILIAGKIDYLSMCVPIRLVSSPCSMLFPKN
jgi:hypothetical protein